MSTVLERDKKDSGVKAGKVLVGVLLDRSGSMRGRQVATIEGFNGFLAEQQGQKEDGSVLSLTQFDNEYEPNFTQPLKKVPELTTETYQPRASTALFDSLLRFIKEQQAWVKAEQWNGRVLIAVITDGLENSSVKLKGPEGLKRLADLIGKRQKKGWEFAFLGAGIDAFDVATHFGIPAGNTTFTPDTVSGTHDTYTVLSSGVTGTRRGATYESAVLDAETQDPETQVGKKRKKGDRDASSSKHS